MIGSEKQQYKKFSGGRDPQAVEALSPPTNGYGGYAFSTSPYSRLIKALKMYGIKNTQYIFIEGKGY